MLLYTMFITRLLGGDEMTIERALSLIILRRTCQIKSEAMISESRISDEMISESRISEEMISDSEPE